MSRFLAEFPSARREIGCMKCLGWTCIPCCCVGCACLSISEGMSVLFANAEAVVRFYGGRDAMIKVAEDVRHENCLFLQALENVRKKGVSMYRLSLLECIQLADDKGVDLGRALSSASAMDFGRIFGGPSQGTITYAQAVFHEYVELGGNTARIVYGLPEYMLQVERTQFTSKGFASLCEAFVNPTQPLSWMAKDAKNKV
jgi:hypothetical protein